MSTEEQKPTDGQVTHSTLGKNIFKSRGPVAMDEMLAVQSGDPGWTARLCIGWGHLCAADPSPLEMVSCWPHYGLDSHYYVRSTMDWTFTILCQTHSTSIASGLP
nr:uncharacterized protein LOC133608570 isoform X3 [Nerophis lumbriciformis]